ncbi:serine hydrolase [Ktedonosporobacter rubrisoli]|uniref:Serine hydrolase n=1 Tax=Ktedonosporobacter rubrisoli TaxID=2509675 RepID=A0A4P6JY94_KTERU|nr:serine hydrolase [Ktedonosporobacter rubrisoli]QBD80778.1 serine hydrolase [Ktedonosporobacter rubrisoli]
MTVHTERLQDYKEFVGTVMKDWQVPGVAVGAVSADEVLFAEGFGKRDCEQGLAVTPQTTFAIGSCTKAFVAMSLAMLVDEGKLEWDKPVRDYLPVFKLSDEVASERITVRDILSHRSGLPGHDALAYNASIPVADLFRRLPYLELNKDMRTAWQYNNLMYAVAGHLIEALSGLSWDNFIRQRILTPLGMSGTSFSVAEMQQKTNDYALPYRIFNDKLERTRYYPKFEMLYGAAGAMNSNVEDMTKWLRCLLKESKYGDGEQRLVSAEQFKQLIEPHTIMQRMSYTTTQYAEESTYCYTLGWWTFTYRGHRFVQHSGGIDGFSVLTTFLPDDNLGTVVLTNRQGHMVTTHGIFTFNLCERLLGLNELPVEERSRQDYERVKEQLEQAQAMVEENRQASAPLSHPLSDYAGEYEHPAYGAFSLWLDKEGLKGLFNDLEYSFSHFHYDVFLVAQEEQDLPLHAMFTSNLEGKIASFSLPLEPAARPIIFQRSTEKAGT